MILWFCDFPIWETADTLAALKEARAKGAKVFGITNVVGSTIARETDGGVYIHAGSEICGFNKGIYFTSNCSCSFSDTFRSHEAYVTK